MPKKDSRVGDGQAVEANSRSGADDPGEPSAELTAVINTGDVLASGRVAGVHMEDGAASALASITFKTGRGEVTAVEVDSLD